MTPTEKLLEIAKADAELLAEAILNLSIKQVIDETKKGKSLMIAINDEYFIFRVRKEGHRYRTMYQSGCDIEFTWNLRHLEIAKSLLNRLPRLAFLDGNKITFTV